MHASASASATTLRRPSLAPHLVCRNAASAIDFYARAFGAELTSRVAGPNDSILHAELQIGDALLMLVDEFPDWGVLGPQSIKGSPVTIHLQVDDADAAVARAVEAGARITMPLEDAFWGDRYGRLEDPFGHAWSVAAHIRDVSPEDIQAAALKACV